MSACNMVIITLNKVLLFCKMFFVNLFFQSHRRQHTKDKPYKCANCNKGYIDAASLEVHMSTHTVKHARIYSCGLCDRTYTSVRQKSISEENFYMKHYESPLWHQTTGRYFTPCSHCFPSNYPPLISGDVSGETHGETQPRAVDCTGSRTSAKETQPKPGTDWRSEPGRVRRWRSEPTCRDWMWRSGQEPARTEPELPPDGDHLLSI